MKSFKLLAVAAGLSFGSAVFAQVIDQNQTDNSVYMASFSQTDLAQSFIQSANDIDGAGIYTQAGVGGGDTITISLYDNLPTNGGNLMASGSIANAQAGQWVDVFWSDTHVNTGQTYYLVFTSNNNTMGIAGSTSNPYPNGETYANPGYQGFANFDYAFRTYHASTPEPASIAALGLGALVLIRRKRRS